MENLKTFFITALPSSPAIFAAFESPSSWTVITSIVLPVALFILSKTVDVLVQVYFKRKQK